MATENKEQEAKGPVLEPAGHGLTITFSISALQHICTAFQRFWNDLLLGDARFGEREQRERSLNLLSGGDRPDLPLNQRDSRDEVPRSESVEHNEPAGQQARGRGIENSSFTSSSVDDSENAITESCTSQPSFLHQETSRDRSSSACGGNEPYNFTGGEDGSGNLFKPCLKFTSVEFNRDRVLGTDILGKLLSWSEIPWTIYFDTSNIKDFEVRYSRRSYGGSSSTKKQLDLTEDQETEAKMRAKGHWICHVCKQIDGEIILNHEERPCSRFDKCRHPLKGCKDCPSRGSHMYEELLEYFRDEIRKEIREGKRHR